MIGVTELARLAAEGIVADEVEGLIAYLVGLGIDQREVDEVVLCLAEIVDHVVVGLADLLEVGEVERVGVGSAVKIVGALAAAQPIVAGAAFDVAGDGAADADEGIVARTEQDVAGYRAAGIVDVVVGIERIANNIALHQSAVEQ